MIVTLTLVALLSQDVLTSPPPPASAEAYIAQQQASGRWRKADTVETSAYLRQGFQANDADRSGFLDAAEVTGRRTATAGPAPSAPPALGRAATADDLMPKMDTDRDGKVSEGEYVSYMMPWTLWSGVPANWARAH